MYFTLITQLVSRTLKIATLMLEFFRFLLLADTVYQRNAAEEDKPGNAAAPHDPKVTGLEMS